MGTLRDFINIDHIEFDRWAPPLFDADWHAFFQAMYKGIEGEEWEELYCHYRDTSKAKGAKKPSECQKAKALWAMKAAKDRVRYTMMQLVKQPFWEEERHVWVCGKSTSKTQS